MKNKILQLIARIACGLLVIIALFLLGISLIFAVSGGAPNIFGYNIYLVETDAFQLLHKGTAVFVVQERMSEIVPGNIIIFDDGTNGPQLGEVQTNELSDGVYSFIALNEANTAVYLTQSQIVGKAMSYSDALGAVIGFAVSPVGVFIIAIIPCLVIIGIEIFKAFNKSLPMPAIEPVNKQQEVPTYVPRARSTQTVYDDEPPSLDDSLEQADETYSYDVQRRAPVTADVMTQSRVINRTQATAVPKPHSATATIPHSATAAIPRPHSATTTIPQQRTATTAIPQPYAAHHAENANSPLFLGPNRQTARKTDTARMLLSQKALNEAIAASKAERENATLRTERTEVIKEIQKNRTSVLERERLEEEERRRIIAEKTARAEQRAVRTEQQDAPQSARRTAQPEGLTAPSREAPRAAAQRATAPTGTAAVPRFNPQNRAAAPRAAVSVTREIPRVPVDEADEIVQQYTPQRRGTVTRATTSLPRLDELLGDENEAEDKRYNIDDILASLDKNS